jgi:hypothetical protein
MHGDAMPRGRTIDARSADGTRIHTEVFGPENGYRRARARHHVRDPGLGEPDR